jgi:hypothetical protein
LAERISRGGSAYGARAVDGVDRRDVVLHDARRLDDRDLGDRAVAVEHDLELGHESRVVERVRHRLPVEVLEEAEAPELVDVPVHAGDERRERAPRAC